VDGADKRALAGGIGLSGARVTLVRVARGSEHDLLVDEGNHDVVPEHRVERCQAEQVVEPGEVVQRGVGQVAGGVGEDVGPHVVADQQGPRDDHEPGERVLLVIRVGARARHPGLVQRTEGRRPREARPVVPVLAVELDDVEVLIHRDLVGQVVNDEDGGDDPGVLRPVRGEPGVERRMEPGHQLAEPEEGEQDRQRRQHEARRHERPLPPPRRVLLDLGREDLGLRELSRHPSVLAPLALPAGRHDEPDPEEHPSQGPLHGVTFAEVPDRDVPVGRDGHTVAVCPEVLDPVPYHDRVVEDGLHQGILEQQVVQEHEELVPDQVHDVAERQLVGELAAIPDDVHRCGLLQVHARVPDPEVAGTRGRADRDVEVALRGPLGCDHRRKEAS
jgi:hypothetical protein